MLQIIIDREECLCYGKNKLLQTQTKAKKHLNNPENLTNAP